LGYTTIIGSEERIDPPDRKCMTSKSAAFHAWWRGYESTGSISPVQLGMARDDIRKLFGEPDDTARGWRRRPLMGIWKFGRIEFHFDTDGRLHLIYAEDENLRPRAIAKASV
jgi:hypothetical protein